MSLFKAARRNNEITAGGEEYSHTAEELELIALRAEVAQLTEENKRMFAKLHDYEVEVRRLKTLLAEAGCAE